MFNVLVIFGFLFVSPRISLLKTSRWSSTIYQENYIIIIPFLFLEVVRGGVFISRIVYFPFFGLSLEKRRKNCVCDVLLLSLSLWCRCCVSSFIHVGQLQKTIFFLSLLSLSESFTSHLSFRIRLCRPGRSPSVHSGQSLMNPAISTSQHMPHPSVARWVREGRLLHARLRE